MVALRNVQQHQRSTDSRRPQRTLTACITGHYWRIAREHRSLTNIATCFIDQTAMLPLQCSEALDRLNDLRRAGQAARIFLKKLDPDTTRLLRPNGCVELLGLLDYQLTELLLYIAVLTPICQAASEERIALHLAIRSLFPRVLGTFDDVTQQLAALDDPERCESNQGERAAL